jgi:hypothetical protein
MRRRCEVFTIPPEIEYFTVFEKPEEGHKINGLVAIFKQNGKERIQ